MLLMLFTVLCAEHPSSEKILLKHPPAIYLEFTPNHHSIMKEFVHLSPTGHIFIRIQWELSIGERRLINHESTNGTVGG
jgi:hypothetical protein